MQAHEGRQVIGDQARHTDARQQLVDVGLDQSGRAVVTAVWAQCVVEALQIDALEAHTRGDDPPAQTDLVLGEEGQRLRADHAVLLAAGQAGAGQRHLAIEHLVAVVLLEAVLLVTVPAQSELELVLGGAGGGAPAQHALAALAVVGAVVVAHPQRVHRAVGTAQPGQALGIRAWVGQDVRQAGAGNVLQLVPGAAELMAVDRRGQVQAVTQLDAMAQAQLLVLGVDAVDLRAAVAPVGRVTEIVQGQAKVGLIADVVALDRLELQLLVEVCVAARIDAPLEQIVAQLIPGIAAAIELLEAIGVLLHGFQQPAGGVAAAAQPGVAEQGRVLAEGDVREAFQIRARDRR